MVKLSFLVSLSFLSVEVLYSATAEEAERSLFLLGKSGDCPFDGEYFGDAVFTPEGRRLFGSCTGGEECPPAVCKNEEIIVLQADIDDPFGLCPDESLGLLCAPDTCFVGFCNSPPIQMAQCRTIPTFRFWITRFECDVFVPVFGLFNFVEEPVAECGECIPNCNECKIAVIKGEKGLTSTWWKMYGATPGYFGKLLGSVNAKNQ